MSAALWSLEELLAATGGRVQGSPGAITGISIDTRALASGDLFVALKDMRDGHDFVGDALASGAAAACPPGPQPMIAARDGLCVTTL